MMMMTMLMFWYSQWGSSRCDFSTAPGSLYPSTLASLASQRLHVAQDYLRARPTPSAHGGVREIRRCHCASLQESQRSKHRRLSETDLAPRELAIRSLSVARNTERRFLGVTTAGRYCWAAVFANRRLREYSGLCQLEDFQGRRQQI